MFQDLITAFIMNKNEKERSVMNIQELLRLLEKDARLNARDLAEILGEDEQEVAEQIDEMEKNKIKIGRAHV